MHRFAMNRLSHRRLPLAVRSGLAAVAVAAEVAAMAALAGGGATVASAATAVVDFDPPGLAQGPSIYVAVPAQQTVDTAPAVFSGGVVLGLATFFPAIVFATTPNVYGTADFGNGLAQALTIDIKPGFLTTEVSFALFNGETFKQSYLVTAMNGANVVASQTLSNILPNFNSGYALADVISPGGITSVTINAINPPGAWDFLIDTVAFNQNIATVLNLPPPPVYAPNEVPPITMQAVDGHRRKQRGKDVIDIPVNQVLINYGDDLNDIKGNFVPFPSPVPEPSAWVLMLAGVAALALKAGRHRLAAEH